MQLGLVEAASCKSSGKRSSSRQDEKLELQKENAAIRAKLAYAERDRQLKLWKLEQEERLEQLKLEKGLAANQARIEVCLQEEQDCARSSSDMNLESLPSVNKDEEM